jgi:hypothetical protein
MILECCNLLQLFFQGSDEKGMLRLSLTNECEQGTQASRLLVQWQARRLRSLCQAYLFITTSFRSKAVTVQPHSKEGM